jgi:hypothetical protein
MPDGMCHRSGIDEHYVKATDNSNGTLRVQPGLSTSCECANKDVLSQDYVVDTVNIYGEFEAPQNSGCLTEHGLGVRLVKGTWCEADTMTNCPPDQDKFTQMIKQNCPRGYTSDVSGAGMCNYVSFNLDSRTVLKRGDKEELQAARDRLAGLKAKLAAEKQDRRAVENSGAPAALGGGATALLLAALATTAL